MPSSTCSSFLRTRTVSMCIGERAGRSSFVVTRQSVQLGVHLVCVQCTVCIHTKRIHYTIRHYREREREYRETNWHTVRFFKSAFHRTINLAASLLDEMSLASLSSLFLFIFLSFESLRMLLGRVSFSVGYFSPWDRRPHY